VSSLKLRKCSREEFVAAISDDPADNFAKTFRAKADMQDLWSRCQGMFIGDELAGAIIVSYSKRSPIIANLQLLHTFAKFRRQGVARYLCDWAHKDCKLHQAVYLRVSAEKPAVPFYESIGMEMLGEQKSGSQLSMCRIYGNSWKDCEYDPLDPVIHKAVHKKGKGGCVKTFKTPEKSVDFFADL
jgi:GNAT superfamily N-acetyltransferase